MLYQVSYPTIESQQEVAKRGRFKMYSWLHLTQWASLEDIYFVTTAGQQKKSETWSQGDVVPDEHLTLAHPAGLEPASPA